MTNLLHDREQFLKAIAEFIKHDPEASAYVASFVQAGLHAALSDVTARAADMESCLMLTINKKYMSSEVEQKLLKWKGKTALNWDSILNYTVKP